MGENDSGKSAVMDAIRIVLGTTDQGWYRVELSDFFNEDRQKEIHIALKFSEISAARLGVIPGMSVSQSGCSSITLNVSVPNCSTIF